jgi:predicted transcriptional regulator
MVMMINLKHCGRKNTHSKSSWNQNIFKSYEVLKAKLDKVLGFDGESPIARTKAEDVKLKTYDDDVQEIMSKKSPALDEDDELNYFKSLAND